MRRLLLTVAAAGILLTGAACSKSSGEPGVATANGGQAAPTPTASAAAGDRTEQLRQFAQCMRDKGVNVNDPQPGQPLGGMGTGINASDPAVQAAFAACQSKLPNGGQPPKLNPQQAEAFRGFAACMRDQGVNVPDPAPDGTLTFDRTTIALAQDPAAIKAFTACRDKLAGVLPTATGAAS